MIRTLKGKVSVIYLCLVLLIALVGLVSILNIYHLGKSTNGLMVDNYKSINAVSNMLEAIERQDSAVLIYLNVDRQKGIELFAENSDTFNKWLNIERSNITEKGESDYVNKIGNYYVNYIKSFSELQEIRNNDGVNKSIDFYNTIIYPQFDKLKQEMKGLSQLNEKAMFAGRDATTNSARQSMYVVSILSFTAVGGGFLLSRFFTIRFLKPIYSLTQTVKLVRAGELNQQITVGTKDEVGELAREFNNMTMRLQQYEKSTLGNLMSERNKSVAIVKSISDPLIVLDTNFRIMLLNDACEKFFDVQEEKVANKHFFEAIRNGEIFEHISGALAAREDYKEKIIYIQSEEDYYFNIIVTAVKDTELNITGLIVLFQNVTQLKKLERVKTDFVATISHEFKTPLTSIIMGTSMILDERLGGLNEEQKSVMNTIREDEMKLSNLVNELMELSKVESDKAIFNIRTNSIEGIIDTSVKQFYELAHQKEVSLYYEVDDNLPKVNVDFEKITWVINNLINNALKYTDAGDEICIAAELKEGKMFVSVKDTGAGIPPEFIDRIFEKFVQVKEHDKEIRGTGLGLSIVKEIIQAHGGQIWCESKLDVGSRFIFSLPLSEVN